MDSDDVTTGMTAALLRSSVFLRDFRKQALHRSTAWGRQWGLSFLAERTRPDDLRTSSPCSSERASAMAPGSLSATAPSFLGFDTVGHHRFNSRGGHERHVPTKRLFLRNRPQGIHVQVAEDGYRQYDGMNESGNTPPEKPGQFESMVRFLDI